MELQVTGTNIEITPEVRGYVEKKLGKLTRYFNNIMEAKVEISEEKTKSPDEHFLIRTTVNGSGAVFHSEERGRDIHMAVDRTADVLTRQVESHKGKLYDKGRGFPFARGKYNAGGFPPPEERKVVKTKKFPVEPMTLRDSVEQMEEMGHDFFIFLDTSSATLKVLYRRKDGNYGLIEPEIA